MADVSCDDNDEDLRRTYISTSFQATEINVVCTLAQAAAATTEKNVCHWLQ